MAKSARSAVVSLTTSVAEQIDALATATDRSRDEIVDAAISQYLAANAWQTEAIRAGISAARAGRTLPADDVFAAIAAKHGW